VNDLDIVVLSSRWHNQNDEMAFSIRAIAGAASRWGQVSVLFTGSGATGADGAYDIIPVASSPEKTWRDQVAGRTVVVDEVTPSAAAFLSAANPGSVFYADRETDQADVSWRQLSFTGASSPVPFLKVSIPLNPLAQKHRHNGFGFVGYLLVLSGTPEGSHEPPAAASWLTAAFHGEHVVVVEDGVASAWKGRALRGRVHVDSRMDLWRLLAHAAVCIDLDPGRLFARECIEAMRFGTPIVVPAGSGPAAEHADDGRGFVYADAQGLIEAVAALRTEPVRSARSERGREYADSNYGNPAEFSESLRAVLHHP
jgi:glycosyltransferase involved in cell wall biosynthesis